ncbi:MAG: GNAT family N-acetyltransferase [Sulfobacillus sp.]|nr:GNAT family N-acetyltransferase [Sulfobacillus sp.]
MIDIRTARTSDLSAFLEAAWDDVEREHFGYRPDWAPVSLAFDAWVNDRRVGALLGEIITGVATVRQLVVSPAWRSTVGIGRALLETFENAAWDQGCHKVTLRTYADSRAEAFYRRRGYVPEARLRQDLGGIDWVILSKWPLSTP